MLSLRIVVSLFRRFARHQAFEPLHCPRGCRARKDAGLGPVQHGSARRVAPSRGPATSSAFARWPRAARGQYDCTPTETSTDASGSPWWMPWYEQLGADQALLAKHVFGEVASGSVTVRVIGARLWSRSGDDMTDAGLVSRRIANAGVRAEAEVCGGERQKGRARRGRSIWVERSRDRSEMGKKNSSHD